MNDQDRPWFALFMSRIHSVFGMGDLSEITIEEFWDELSGLKTYQLEFAYREMRGAWTSERKRGMPYPADLRKLAYEAPKPQPISEAKQLEGAEYLPMEESARRWKILRDSLKQKPPEHPGEKAP